MRELNPILHIDSVICKPLHHIVYIVDPLGIEPRFLPWKGSYLTFSRWSYSWRHTQNRTEIIRLEVLGSIHWTICPFIVVLIGLEPINSAPKTDVLPLHQRTIKKSTTLKQLVKMVLITKMNIHLKPSLNCSAKVSKIFETTKLFPNYF